MTCRGGMGENRREIWEESYVWVHMAESCCCTAETNTTLKSNYCSVPKSCPTLCDPMNCSSPGFPVLHYHPEFVQTHVHWVSNAIQPPHPLSSPSPLALNLSQHQSLFQQVFSKASASASVLPMNIQGWLPLGLTGFDLPAVQGIFKSLLQHHSSKASILHCSAFFMVQLSHPFITIWKTLALTIWTFVSKATITQFSKKKKKSAQLIHAKLQPERSYYPHPTEGNWGLERGRGMPKCFDRFKEL